LRSQLLRWSIDNAEAIAKATPEIPPGFDNRREDNWIPLLAIAEACGGEWKTAAWTSALALEDITDDTSTGVQLLQAIKAAFEARANASKNKDRIKSEDLIEELEADATAPWATWNKGKPISQRQVAKLLKDYETPQGTPIKPRTIRFDDGTKKGTTAKGYLLEWFTDAFERFCTSSSSEAPDSSVTSSSGPPEEPNLSVTSVTSLNPQDFSQFSSVTPQGNVTDKKDRKSFKNNDVTDVTDKNGAGEPRKEDIADVTDENGEDRGLHPQQIRQLATSFNEEAYRRLSGSVLEPNVLNGDLRRRLREEYGVFPEFIAVEFERVMEVAFAPPQAEPETTKATEKATASAPYQVLGSAPAGERCDACGKAGGARIRLDGTVYLLHQACADRYLAAMVDPPVKIPEWPGADHEMADGRPDDPIDPDAWSFNDDAEPQS
jgi:hypothetical protein